MVFSSLKFIFIFMPIFFGCYYIVPGRIKNMVLLIGSLCFYFIGIINNPEYLFKLLLYSNKIEEPAPPLPKKLNS